MDACGGLLSMGEAKELHEVIEIMVSPNPLKAYRHVFQWLHCIVSVHPLDYGAR